MDIIKVVGISVAIGIVCHIIFAKNRLDEAFFYEPLICQQVDDFLVDGGSPPT